MVRERRLVNPTLAALLAAFFGAIAVADESKPTVTPGPVVETKPTVTPAPVPLDRQPYRIHVLLSSHPTARIDAPRRETLVSDWLTLTHRFVGAPWIVEVADESASAAAATGVATLTPAELRDASQGFDKVWVVRVDGEGAGLAFVGREFDVTTGRLGPLQRRVASVTRDAPRVFLKFAFDLFAPYAEIGERFGKSVTLTVRAASIAPATDLGRVAPEGTVFLPLRVVPQKEGPALVRELPFTFLRVEASAPGGAKCGVVSVYSDPFTRRVVQKSTYQALGVKPGQKSEPASFPDASRQGPRRGLRLDGAKLPRRPPAQRRHHRPRRPRHRRPLAVRWAGRPATARRQHRADDRIPLHARRFGRRADDPAV